MTKLLKETVKNILARYNYRLVYTKDFTHDISGISLFKDLRYLITNEGPVCFDVGANEGQTIHRLRHIFPRASIYAFEPSVDSFRILQEKHFDSSVFLYNFALGDQCRQQDFINYENSSLSSFLTLSSSTENRFRSVRIRKKEMVDIKTIDEFVQENDIQKIDLLKIDTQGYDLHVLQGAARHFENDLICHVLIELNFVNMYEQQCDAQQISKFLANYGLHLVDYYEKVRPHHTPTLSWCTALFARRSL